jgi:hypothetical protein
VDDTAARVALEEPRRPGWGSRLLSVFRTRSDPRDTPLLGNYRRPAIGTKTQWLLIALLGVAALPYGYFFASLAPHVVMPFMAAPAVLMLLLIWALPAGDYAPTRAVGGFFWAFFVSLIVWPNYLAIALPGLPWLTVARLTGGPLVACVLICVSVSKPFRQEMSDYLNAVPNLWKALVAYIVVMTLTLPLSSHPGDSLNRYIIFQVTNTSIFFAACYVFARKPGRVEYWIYLLLAMDVLISFIGIWEDRLGHVPWAGHIPSFLKIEDDVVTRILNGGSRAATGEHRIASVQTTSLGLAELIGISSPFALHVAVGRHPIIIRLFGAFCIPLFMYTVELTDARLGYVAMLVSLAGYLFIWSIVRWREVKSSVLGPAIVFSYPAIFCAMVASTFLVGKIRRKVWGDGSQAASNETRKEQWIVGMPKVFKHPFGHGYGMAGSTLGMSNGAGVGSIDSYYLNLLLDTGFLGFLFFMAIFWSGGVNGFRNILTGPNTRETRLLIPLVVSLAAFIVVKAVLSQDANHPLVFMILGAVVALIYRAEHVKKQAEGNAALAALSPR